MPLILFLENPMSRMHNVVLPVALFLSALALSACATKPNEEPVAVPAPVEITAPAEVAVPVEAPAAPVVEAEPAPAPAVVAAELPTAKQAVHKAKKKLAQAKPAPPVAAPPAPVEAPAPVMQPDAPVIRALPPVVVAPPMEKIPEAGFFEKYWLWLLVLGLVIAGTVTWKMMSKGEER
jgi:hypothetical protein